MMIVFTLLLTFQVTFAYYTVCPPYRGWNRPNISWNLHPAGNESLRDLVIESIQFWENCSDYRLQFFEDVENPDINITIYIDLNDHNDGFQLGDGIRGHAYYPGPNIGGDIHIPIETAVSTTMRHEFGHALGLAHVSFNDSVMIRSGNLGQCSELDRQRIKHLFDAKSIIPKGSHFTSVTVTNEGIVLAFFEGGFVKMYNPKTVITDEVLQADEFKDCYPLPDQIDAVFDKRNTLFVFSGSTIYSVTRDGNCTTNAHAFGDQRVDAVVVWNGKEIWIGGNTVMTARWAKRRSNVFYDYPLPSTLRGAFVHNSRLAIVTDERVVFYNFELPFKFRYHSYKSLSRMWPSIFCRMYWN